MGKRMRRRRLNQKSLGWQGPLAPVSPESVVRLGPKVMLGIWENNDDSPVVSPEERLEHLYDNPPILIVRIDELKDNEYGQPSAYWSSAYLNANITDHNRITAGHHFANNSTRWQKYALFIRGQAIKTMLEKKVIVEYAPAK